MNKLENAVSDANGSLVIRIYKDEAQNSIKLDKTWKEIHDAMLSGIDCILTCEDRITIDDQAYIYQFVTRAFDVYVRDYTQISGLAEDSITYIVERLLSNSEFDSCGAFFAASETDYPMDEESFSSTLGPAH